MTFKARAFRAVNYILNAEFGCITLTIKIRYPIPSFLKNIFCFCRQFLTSPPHFNVCDVLANPASLFTAIQKDSAPTPHLVLLILAKLI